MILDGKKVLIVKPSSLGDIIHSLPFLEALKKTFPGARVHWVVARGFEGILEGHPLIERLWVIHKDDWKKIERAADSVRELLRLFRGLKAERFDCVVDLQGLLRSGVIAMASGAPVRVGFREAREGSTVFYTDSVKGGRDIHAVDRYLRVAGFLGCDVSEVRFPFPPAGGSLKQADPLFDLTRNDYAVMVPGARGAAKRWPADRFGELASRLPMKTVVIGSRADSSLANELVEASRGSAVSLAGGTGLKDLVEVIRCARFMVCNDTGPMHIAAALGVRVFALFGPTNPARTGPYGTGHSVIRKDIPCSPCYRKDCKSPLCMDMIKVGEVEEVITEALARR